MSEERAETGPAEAQTSDSTHDKPGSFWIIWIIISLLLAYPLSIGPAAKFYGWRGRGAPAAVRTFYAPLAQAYNRNHKVKKAIDWYVGLWGTQL
jgi:hypothetical protein